VRLGRGESMHERPIAAALVPISRTPIDTAIDDWISVRGKKWADKGHAEGWSDQRPLMHSHIGVA
jgi:hypothetical protein